MSINTHFILGVSFYYVTVTAFCNSRLITMTTLAVKSNFNSFARLAWHYLWLYGKICLLWNLIAFLIFVYGCASASRFKLCLALLLAFMTSCDNSAAIIVILPYLWNYYYLLERTKLSQKFRCIRILSLYWKKSYY